MGSSASPRLACVTSDFCLIPKLHNCSQKPSSLTSTSKQVDSLSMQGSEFFATSGLLQTDARYPSHAAGSTLDHCHCSQQLSHHQNLGYNCLAPRSWGTVEEVVSQLCAFQSCSLPWVELLETFARKNLQMLRRPYQRKTCLP